MGGRELEREKGERKEERASPAELTGGKAPVSQVGTTLREEGRGRTCDYSRSRSSVLQRAVDLA